MANADYQPRLKTVYKETIRKQLLEQFKYENEMQVPRLDKIVLNMGVGEATGDSKKPTVAAEDRGDAGPQVDCRLQGAREHADRRKGHPSQGPHVRVP